VTLYRNLIYHCSITINVTGPVIQLVYVLWQ